MGSEIPQGAFLKSISATYNERSLPRDLKTLHTLDDEVWGKVVVEEGKVLLCVGSEANAVPVTPEAPGIIPEGNVFCLKSADVPTRFHIEHYHVPLIRDASQLASLLSHKEV